MLWYNILNPRDWPGVSIQTGNNKIDGIYYNLLSSNQVSLAASGSMFLTAGSGIKLISPSYVDTSGIRCNAILSENFYRIDTSGNIIPLYSGVQNGLVFKSNDNTLISTDVMTYNTGNNTIQFPSANPGNPLYVVPSYIQNGVLINSTNELSSFEHLVFKPQETDAADPPNVISPPTITANSLIIANSGINLGVNNNLDSYKGFILTHAGSGEPAEWKPATYLRENYDTTLPYDGLEQVGVSWIRFPKRPIKLLSDGRIAFYTTARQWSPYEPLTGGIDQIIAEFGEGSDTIQVENIGSADVEVSYDFIKFAAVDKFPYIRTLPTGTVSGPYDFADIFESTTTIDPLDENDPPTPAPVLIVNICPGQPLGAIDQNGFAFSVTKGAYFPMQLGHDATDNLACPTQSDQTEFTFKPSTSTNISIRPDIHTAFNMLGENIDFLIYPKNITIPYNNYDSSVYDLNDNYIPQNFIPVFKVDANIPNAVSGNPASGVFYSKYLDREKTIPSGFGFDANGKVSINTSGAYVIDSIVSGEGVLSTYADLTVSGSTFSNSVIAEQIFLRPKPLLDGSSNYLANALLTVDYNGQIISRVPRLSPVLPDAPLNIRGSVGHNNAGNANNEYSIEWDAPVDDGRSKIISYSIQFSLDNGESWTVAQTDEPASVAYVDRGLNNQRSATIKTLPGTVRLRVAAQNSVGISDYSEATELLSPNNNVPIAPTLFSGVRTFDGTVSDIALSWTNSAQNGLLGSFSGYILEESEDYGLTWYYYNSPSDGNFITNTNETIYGLKIDQDYLYRISSWNSSGQSAYSYFYSSGLKEILIDPEEEEASNDVLGDWDFGVVLFTGVCNI